TTATRAMISRQAAIASVGDLPNNFQYQYTAAGVPMTVGPKAVVQGDPLEVSVTDMEQVSGQTMRLYLYGRADYEDMFGGSGHFTQYCRRMIISPTPDDPFKWVGLTHYGDYNSTDDDSAPNQRLPWWKFWG